MNTKIDPKILPKNKNEGKVNSKGMAAPPVPPRALETKLSSENELAKKPVSQKSRQAKFAVIRAKFEQNDHNKAVSNNLKRTFGPTMQKLMEDNIPNKQRRDSGISSCSDVSLDEKDRAYSPLDWSPNYQGKKRFSLGDMSSNSSSYSEKSNISDISDNSNIVRCSITRSNSKENLRKPDASHNDESAGKKLSNVNVSELIRKFEQGNDIVRGR